MKSITLFAVVLTAFCSIANAAPSDTIQDLPAQVIQYGSLPAPEVQPIPALPSSIADSDGYVLMRFEILASGRLANIEVLEASDPQMAKFSRAMVRRWSYDNPGESVVALQPIVFEAGSHRPLLLASR